MSLASLSGGQMEEQYMATVQKHTAGETGKRGCDLIAHAFGALVQAMEETRKDILGDLFQGAITYAEAGQLLTPEHICRLMAQMNIEGVESDAGERKTVADPCCGSGRMLLAAADLKPHWEFVGQDVDLRCVRMTAINFALRNLYGHVIWGNSLANERRLVYRTGFNLTGFLREVPIEGCPAPVQLTAVESVDAAPLAQADRLIERQKLRDELVGATRVLVEALSTGGYHILGIEVEVSKPAFGKTLNGSIDCVAARDDGSDPCAFTFAGHGPSWRLSR